MGSGVSKPPVSSDFPQGTACELVLWTQQGLPHTSCHPLGHHTRADLRLLPAPRTQHLRICSSKTPKSHPGDLLSRPPAGSAPLPLPSSFFSSFSQGGPGVQCRFSLLPQHGSQTPGSPPFRTAEHDSPSGVPRAAVAHAWPATTSVPRAACVLRKPRLGPPWPARGLCSPPAAAEPPSCWL